MLVVDKVQDKSSPMFPENVKQVNDLFHIVVDEVFMYFLPHPVLFKLRKACDH